MKITVTVDVPDAVAQEGTPLVALEKGIDPTNMTAQQLFNAVAQEFANEIVERMKEAIVRNRVEQVQATAKTELE